MGIAIDSTALLALLGLASITFGLTFGGARVWVVAGVGALAGVAVGVLGAVRRFPTWLVAVLTVAAYFLLGSPLALPSQTVGGVLPTPSAASGLAIGAVTAWKGLLTIDPPIGATAPLLVVPLITMLLAGVIGATIALRTTRAGLAWLAPAAAAVVGICFGVQTPLLPLALAVGFLSVALAWTSYRRLRLRRALFGNALVDSRLGSGFGLRPLALGAGVLALAAFLTAAAQPIVAPSASRAVLRDVVEPPLDVAELPSPLQGFRKNLLKYKEEPIMTVSGLPEGVPIRIATLDAYDGVTFNVANSATGGPDGGSFRRIGSEVADPGAGQPASVQITLNNYVGAFVPTVGQLRSISFSGEPSDPRRALLADNFFYNRATGTAVDTQGIESGDSYRLEASVPSRPAASEIAQATAGTVQLPPAEPLPAAVKDNGQRLAADATTLGEVAVAFEKALRRGYYSNGLDKQVPSPSGHSVYRMQKLFNDKQMIGDEEQYAVAMALLARSAGLGSRVVYGYVPTKAGEVVVEGKDVSAWTEVNLEGLGWVTFRPTPDKDREPETDAISRQSKPRPQVENPPPPPVRPEIPPPDNTPPQEADPDDDVNLRDWRRIALIAIGVGIPLLLLSAPIGIIVALKRRRRRLRLTDPEPSARISGGWAEIVDRARDLGMPAQPWLTRTEMAQVISRTFERTSEASVPPSMLAWRADSSVFGSGEPSELQVDSYWQGVGDLQGQLGNSVTRWRRIRGAVSLKSLRGRS